MRHLFVINPEAGRVKGKVRAVKEEIDGFFSTHPDIGYDIHVTRWCREATGFVRRYVSDMYLSDSREPVRVHAMGGSGTLYEALNGVMGLPNVQIAGYPFGDSNAFLRYFGAGTLPEFDSLCNQIFSDTVPIDVIRCGTKYGLSHITTGMGADALSKTTEAAQMGLPMDISYLALTGYLTLSDTKVPQFYEILLDGRRLDGRYISILVANGPCFGKRMFPAAEAHPNDGLLDLYLMKPRPKSRLLSALSKYPKGAYRHAADVVWHHRGSSLTIHSGSVMSMNIDGEPCFSALTHYEVEPGALNFVCPPHIRVKDLPRLYSNAGKHIFTGGAAHG